MNNIRELIIQRVFLKPLSPLRGLCCMSHRLCLFFFSCFLALLHEEVLLFSSGEKKIIIYIYIYIQAPPPSRFIEWPLLLHL